MNSLKKAALGVLLGLFILSWNSALGFDALSESFKRSATLDNLKRAEADNWNIVGSNLLIRGNIYIPLGDFDIYADQGIIDLKSHSFSVKGNIRVNRKVRTALMLEPAEIAVVERMPGITATLDGVSTDIFGRQKVKVTASYVSGRIKADTLSGNLTTGFFEFSKAELDFNSFGCRAESGERRASGVIVVRGAEMSTCGYLESDNAHYSIACREAHITPYDTGSYGLENLNPNRGDYSVFAINCFGKVYGLPILWLPVMYKPKDEKFGLPQFQWGSNNSWGFFFSLSKKYHLADYPNTSIRVLGDYYEKRGFGYGAEVFAETDNSRTEIMAYSIYDIRPYETDKYYRHGVRVPHARYTFRISNVTHITPTLDFRGHFETMNDPFINRDFFNRYYNSFPEPVTFAALEKQFRYLSTALYFRPRIDDYFNIVERLPEWRLDVPRQELFGTNLYYQGEMSLAYLRRRWAVYDFADRFLRPGQKLKALPEYEAGRFDNVHFFYYPIRLDWLTIIPRAGFRMTAYTDSSETRVGEKDLEQMLVSNDIGQQNIRLGDFVTYDDKGGSRFRFAGEFGLEMTTKIYNSWQDVRSSFFGVDGLRHLLQPYINYNFIPKPSESRDHLYYFDDIDRIDEQHFVRLGMVNRLQTRSGDNRITDILTMENYWDFHFQRRDGFNNIGDFCTRLAAKPFQGLSIDTFFSIAVDGQNEFWDSDTDIYRSGRNVGHPGLYAKWLNRWEFKVSYEPVRDYIFTFSYNYQNRYRSLPAYSMGSTLSDVTGAGSAFQRFFSSQIQQLTFGVSAPITPDRRTRAAFSMSYDFNSGFAPNYCIAIVHTLHCWEIAAEINIDTKNDSKRGKEHNTSFFITAYLSGLTSPLQQTQQGLLSGARSNFAGGSGRNF